jgi:hypothetical protein
MAALLDQNMVCAECKIKDNLITDLRSKIFDLEAKIGLTPVVRPSLLPALSPNISHITLDVVEPLFRLERVLTPAKLVELIWINVDHPENFSMYSLDEKKDEVYVFGGKTWVKDTRLKLLGPIRKMVYDLTLKFIPQMKPGGAVNPTLIEQVKVNVVDDELIHTELMHIQKLLIANAHLLMPIAAAVPAGGAADPLPPGDKK